MRSLLLLIILLSSSALFAYQGSCPNALPPHDPGFCGSFRSVALCICRENLPDMMCKDMVMLHNAMISRYGSVENACHHQDKTPYQICVDDWSCYLNGGKDSEGYNCGKQGTACENHFIEHQIQQSKLQTHRQFDGILLRQLKLDSANTSIPT